MERSVDCLSEEEVRGIERDFMEELAWFEKDERRMEEIWKNGKKKEIEERGKERMKVGERVEGR